MKKTLFLMLTVSCIVLAIQSCTKEEKPKKKDIVNNDNNNGDACDTSFVAGFADKVAPILNGSCVGCHNSAGATAGIILDSYSQVKNNATRILRSINHDPSLSPSKRMPPAGKLDSCSIRTIERWVNTGFPE